MNSYDFSSYQNDVRLGGFGFRPGFGRPGFGFGPGFGRPGFGFGGFGFGPGFGFGLPFLTGFTAGALLRPPFPYYQPYPFNPYPPFPCC